MGFARRGAPAGLVLRHKLSRTKKRGRKRQRAHDGAIHQRQRQDIHGLPPSRRRQFGNGPSHQGQAPARLRAISTMGNAPMRARRMTSDVIAHVHQRADHDGIATEFATQESGHE